MCEHLTSSVVPLSCKTQQKPASENINHLLSASQHLTIKSTDQNLFTI